MPVLFACHHWNFNQKPSRVASLWALNSGPHVYKVCTFAMCTIVSQSVDFLSDGNVPKLPLVVITHTDD